MKFSGTTSLDDLRALVDKNLYLKRKNLPPIDDNEFYWTDILDMQVVSTGDQYLGKVVDILATGANDVFVIKDESNEILIPAICDVVRKIDYDKNTIVVEHTDDLI